MQQAADHAKCAVFLARSFLCFWSLEVLVQHLVDKIQDTHECILSAIVCQVLQQIDGTSFSGKIVVHRVKSFVHIVHRIIFPKMIFLLREAKQWKDKLRDQRLRVRFNQLPGRLVFDTIVKELSNQSQCPLREPYLLVDPVLDLRQVRAQDIRCEGGDKVLGNDLYLVSLRGNSARLPYLPNNRLRQWIAHFLSLQSGCASRSAKLLGKQDGSSGFSAACMNNVPRWISEDVS